MPVGRIAIFIFLMYLCHTLSLRPYTSESDERDIRTLLEEFDKDMNYYEHRLRPKDRRNYPGKDHILVVNISIEVMSVRIDEEKLRLELLITEGWFDERINISVPDNFRIPDNKKLWMPSFDVLDTRKLEDCRSPQLLLTQKARIVSSCRVLLEQACKEDEGNYPFSKKFCNVTLGNKRYERGREVYRCHGCFRVKEHTLEDSTYYYEWAVYRQQDERDRDFKLMEVVDAYKLEEVRRRGSMGMFVEQDESKDTAILIRLQVSGSWQSYSYHIYALYLPSIFILILVWFSGIVAVRGTLSRNLILIGSSGMTLFLWSMGRKPASHSLTYWDKWCLASFIFIMIAMFEQILRDTCCGGPSEISSGIESVGEADSDLLGPGKSRTPNGTISRSAAKGRTVKTAQKRPNLKDVIVANFGPHFCFMIAYILAYIVFCAWYFSNANS